MKRDWGHLPQASVPTIHLGRAAKTEVLVEYDGPHLVLHTYGQSSHLALLADSDAQAERWVYAKLSSLELQALALGGLPMRDVFSRKLSVEVVEVRGTKPRLAWEMDPALLPAGLLPLRQAPLPSAARAFLQRKLRSKPAIKRRIRFAGSPVHGHGIELSALSRLTSTLQQFFSTIGGSLGIFEIPTDTGMPSTAVLAEATGKGSFAIELRAANDAVLSRVLKRYQELMQLAHDDSVRLKEVVSSDAALAKGLEQYVAALSELGAESFVESPETLVYVGGPQLSAIREALRPLKKPRAARETSASQVTMHRGHFDEFGRVNATFAFHDIDTGETLEGDVDAPLVERMRRDPRGQISWLNDQLEATVGGVTSYRAHIEHGPRGLVLVAFEPLK